MRVLFLVILLISEVHAQNYPKTVSECVDSILVNLPIADKALLKYTPHKKIVSFHLGLGTWIRNKFGLWSSNETLLSQCAKLQNQEFIHPDEAAGIILDSLWYRIQKEELEFTIPKSVEVKSKELSKSEVEEFQKYFGFTDIAWRSGLNLEYKIVIDTDSNNQIKKIQFIPNKEMAGMINYNETLIRKNWSKIITKIEISSNSKIAIELKFNSLGKKFEEYMK